MNYEYCDGITYTIKKGDTLYEISRKHNVALALLLRANPYIDVFNLQIGDTICIPTIPQMPPAENVGGSLMPPAGNMSGSPMPPVGNMSGSLVPPMENMGASPMPSSENQGVMQMLPPENDNDGVMQEGEELRQNTGGEKAENDIAAGRWEKYVVQPGDTLEDVMRGMNGDAEKFFEKNSPAGIYMLPGVAYYVFMEED